jgi:hypothetical protein
MAQWQRYTVTIETEFNSEWDLTPASFPDLLPAIRHAIGIAKSWKGRRGTPPIRIRSDNGYDEFWSMKRLLVIGLLLPEEEDQT